MNKKKQIGNAMVEYLVATIVVLVILGATNISGQGSAITMFLNAVSTGFDRFSGFISLP